MIRRTAVLILMMIQSGIMTTDIKTLIYRSLDELFEPEFFPDSYSGLLSALGWEARAGIDPDASQARAVFQAVKHVLSSWQTCSIWLYACHAAWQRDTRLKRMSGFWKSLEREGIKRPVAGVAEALVEDKRGLKWTAVGRIDLSEIGSITHVLRLRKSAFLLFSEQEIDRAQFIDEGWLDLGTGNVTSLIRLATVAAKNKALFGRTYGQFDDPFVGIDIIGSREQIELMAWNF